MTLTAEDITFIIYNNRSVDGVVSNFLPGRKLDPFRLIKLERRFARCDSVYNEARTVEIVRKDLNLECTDISYGPDDLEACLDLVLASMDKLIVPGTKGARGARGDRDWLLGRGLRTSNMRGSFLGSLSYIIENATQRQLEVLGVSCHPMLTDILDDDLSGGGIVIPLFENDRLVNVTTRRISDVGKLKYTQSCPDMHVWGVEAVDLSGPVWMTEGLFDMMALHWEGVRSASVSSAMWSVPQLMQLMDRAGDINIFADNDKVGLRTAAVMREFLLSCGHAVRTYVSTGAKDPAEHFLEKKLGWSDVVEIDITPEMIESEEDMTFNFLKYLKNRKF